MKITILVNISKHPEMLGKLPASLTCGTLQKLTNYSIFHSPQGVSKTKRLSKRHILFTVCFFLQCHHRVLIVHHTVLQRDGNWAWRALGLVLRKGLGKGTNGDSTDLWDGRDPDRATSRERLKSTLPSKLPVPLLSVLIYVDFFLIFFFFANLEYKPVYLYIFCRHISTSTYGRKSADRTEHGNYVIFFLSLATVFGNLEVWKVKK